MERFWNKVEVAGLKDCWEWTAVTANGYGKFWINELGRKEYAHRVSWRLHHGEIPDGLCVLHHCDNRLCVNPGHLFLGTKQDNSGDMYAKQRENIAREERHPRAKITRRQAEEIRALYATGEYSYKRLAQKYGITVGPISAIIHRRTWRSAA